MTLKIELYQLWLVAKVVVAVGLLWWETRYPMWETTTTGSSKRPWHIHEITRRFIIHCIVNPEWALIKIITLVPVCAFTGARYVLYFLPIKIPRPMTKKTVPRKTNECPLCSDSGIFANNKLACSCKTVENYKNLVKRVKI